MLHLQSPMCHITQEADDPAVVVRTQLFFKDVASAQHYILRRKACTIFQCQGLCPDKAGHCIPQLAGGCVWGLLTHLGPAGLRWNAASE
jgi:hypothetical protein